MAKKRTNIVPIIEDARHPHKYRMLVPMVDTIFADVAQPDQVNKLLLTPPLLLCSLLSVDVFLAHSSSHVFNPLFQARIVAINASYFLKNGGNFVISIKANCIDSTAEAEAVFAGEVKVRVTIWLQLNPQFPQSELKLFIAYNFDLMRLDQNIAKTFPP